METDVDVVVLGLGPGGEFLAGALAEAGLQVVGVEAHLVGGECPYYGCIPSKMMVRAAHTLAEARRVDDLAGKTSIKPDFGKVAHRIRGEATDNWDDQVAAERLENKGVRLVRGRGKLDGPGRVRVYEQVFVARRGVVLATGTSPAVPAISGLADVQYWTNREAVRTRTAPASLIVLGGGAIGVELAQVFARFGSQVTVLEGAERVLSAEEPEASAIVESVFTEEGITVRTGVKAQEVSQQGKHCVVRLADETSVRATQLLIAVGRDAGLNELGLASVGVNELVVDDRMRAGDKLWAIGDITGKGAFTHVSMYQAEIALRDIMGEEGPAADYRALPRVTFTDPEVGAVGMTRAQAEEAGLNVITASTDLAESSRGWIHQAQGLINLVIDKDHDRLVGATSVGPCGGEVLGALAVAIHAQVPVSQLRHMLYAYPTFHRAILDTLKTLD